MSKTKKKQSEQGLPESLFQWQHKILAEPTVESVQPQQPKQKPDNEARLREVIAKEGLRLKLEQIIHERGCVAPCQCDCRALILSREGRRIRRRIVRLPR